MEKSIKINKFFYYPVILATQGAEIRRIKIQSQPRQIVRKTLFQKYPSQKRAGGVAQGVALSSGHSTAKKKKFCCKIFCCKILL
jgi:hypothetical protein